MREPQDACDRIRVLVVDDHRTVTDLLQLVLNNEDDLCCVATVHDARAVPRAAELHRPDVVVMDVHLKDADGLECTRKLTAGDPSLKVVVLTGHADMHVVQRAAAAGACALLAKDGALPDLLRTIRTVRPGAFLVGPELLQQVMEAEEHQEYMPPLSRREDDVLQLLATGMSLRGIAEDLGISLHTCRGYVKTLMVKLGAHSQLEAVLLAGQRSLLRAPAV
jgi:DNA-binding NarL/FixJ family response regulator